MPAKLKRSGEDLLVGGLYLSVLIAGLFSFFNTLRADLLTERQLTVCVVFAFFGLSFSTLVVNPTKHWFSTVVDLLEIVFLILMLNALAYFKFTDLLPVVTAPRTDLVFILLMLLISLQMLARLIEGVEDEDHHAHARIMAVLALFTGALCHPLPQALHIAIGLFLFGCMFVYVRKDHWLGRGKE